MHESPIVTIGGIQFDLAAIIMLLVTCIIVFVLARVGTSRLSVNNPSKMQNFLEWVVDFVAGLISSTMDMKKGKSFLMLGITLIMFIFVGNMLGLPFGIVTEVNTPQPMFGITEQELHHAHEAGKHIALAWWKSPTADVAVTMALALMVIFMVHFLGLTRNTHHYLKHYVEPHWAMFPLNVIKEVSKLLTLGLRLFGNIYAGEVLIGVILMAGPLGAIPLVVWQGFSVFVGAIQAFVFTILTMVYLSQAIDHGDHEEAH
ncbi:F0F1 ATP synthase subunit A [Paenibacillus cremeus]|uniref:ATP synthase subunit a n=1 Tax=Paenibacillus cremeus TaxID=2163881 RepID=A0A559KAX8_9BACL|nr:F0F1 ATP synthase subunit A [Paenibacillus cremeus]TVY09287.1 F0F1 ATP synthase subunit A [Paenibacillus cremeus]